MSVNKVILVGRLGQDPELKSTASGTDVCNFSLATTENHTDKSGEKKEMTEWHNIVVWGKLASLCNQYLTKGLPETQTYKAFLCMLLHIKP